ncbi:MFS transporter [Actinokineospora soli]|uniref:MFS transporter n=1 Tax=Actinokineospora soli TaxID=1048753 RepID=A0ABW2TP79_9PSEU
MLADRVVRGAVAAQALWGVGVTGVSVVTPLVHQRDLGLGPAGAAVPLVAVAAALIVTAPLTPRLCLRYGQAAVAAAGLVVVAVGLGAIAAVGHLPVLWPRLPGLVLVGVGSAGAVPLTTLALDAAGRAAGAVSGLLGTAREFAGAIGVALVAAVATSAAGYTAALAAAALAQLAAAVCVRTLCSPDKAPKETAHPTDKVVAGRKRR